MRDERYVWYKNELAEVEHWYSGLPTIRLVRENISFVAGINEIEPVSQEDLEALADEYDLDLSSFRQTCRSYSIGSRVRLVEEPSSVGTVIAIERDSERPYYVSLDDEEDAEHFYADELAPA